MAPTVDLRRPSWKRVPPSPRHLVLRHGRRQFRKLRPPDAPTVVPPLSPGQEQLFSSYVPGLQAGPHRIDVKQDMAAGGQTMEQATSHLFRVVGPRFALPDGVVDSFYPPRGHTDKAAVLPHMVFNDPTLPWERPASSIGGDDVATNTVPWLAVLLFTQDELRLSSADLSTMFAETSLGTGAKQSDTLTINMLAAEIPKVKNAASAVVYDPDADGADAKTDLVFLPSALFNSLFTHYDAQGRATPKQANGWVRPYRFLAHLRHIHLDGTATAATTDDDTHTYSTVVAHRTGPLDITQPTTVVAHLVNIEGVEAGGWPVAQGSYVAMSSLYSWDYTCLPPTPFNVADAFAQLGASISPLRPGLTPDDEKAFQLAGAVGCRMASRIHDGFSMVRYRLQTGEVSAGFFRGPFTPTVVTFPDTEVPPWPTPSNTGTKLQVLDQEVNLMDLTYSAAWTLGKTLALADLTFAAALSRVRRQIFDQAMKEAQRAAVKTWAANLGIPSPHRTREDVISSIADTVDGVGELPGSKLLPDDMVHRWFRPELPRLDLTYKGSEIDPIINQYLEKAAAIVASTTDGSGGPYNEFNVPYSPDWAVVLKWVMDRYFLVNVPSHYLISDASNLPQESLRFFNVDSAWVCAMVDGGLSLANHLDRSDDRLRDAIKGAVNTYLATPIPGLGYVPPVPTYGFLVRSALLTRFPDLVVGLKGEDKTDGTGPPEILRHQVVGQDTMLGLLRAPPEDPAFTSLLLREPPHQLSFSAAESLTPQTIDMEYQRVYTDSKANDPDSNHTIPYTDTRGDAGNPRGVNFIWGTTATESNVRILNMENYANDVQQQLVDLFKPHPTWYNAPYPFAALMGIELNEPCWQLEVQLPYGNAPSLAGGRARHHYDQQDLSVLLRLSPKRQFPPRKEAVFPKSPPIACAPHPAFGERTRAAPLRDLDPAPNVRVPRTGAPGLPPTAPPASGRHGGTSPPQFTYLLYPVAAAAAGQSRVPMLPADTKQNLVFSIVLTPGTGQDFQLTSLAFSVPLGGATRPLLAEGFYTATMLSNVRFNAIVQLTPDGSALTVSLQPRSVKGYWPAADIDEMSFLLSGVVVHRYDQETAIDMPVVESYTSKTYSNKLSVELVPS